MNFHLDDLGFQSYGDICRGWRCARNPRTDAQLVVGALANNGLIILDPRKGSGQHILSEKRFTTGWAVGQSPDGDIYLSGFSSDNAPNALVRWNWNEEKARIVTEISAKAVFTLDVASNGTVFLPDYKTNTLFAYLPGENRISAYNGFERFGDHIRNVFCGRDGLVYLTCTDYSTTRILFFNPESGHIAEVAVSNDNDGKSSWETHQLLKDATGRILVPAGFASNRPCWHELFDGGPRPIDADDPIVQRFNGPAMPPLAFPDGSYIESIDDDGQQSHIAFVNARNHKNVFTVARENAPLRIFSLCAGRDRIWGSTFIPITLFSFDPATDASSAWGNPTASTGEIYSMVVSGDNLYAAAYTHARLSRFNPKMQWDPGSHAESNPRYLGQIKEEGLPLHRPYGKAMDHDGNIFFSAKGDYGCPDSGIARLDPQTETVTRWIYPDTTFSSMIYLPESNLLLTGEKRLHDNTLHATFVSPENGKIVDRVPLFHRSSGEIHAWLLDPDENRVYGLHGYQAMLFSFNLKEKRIDRKLAPVGSGTHCHESLLFGPDGNIWCLTVDGVYAVDRDLRRQFPVVTYPDKAGGNHYRFGMVQGPDGAVYFPNGKNLMRIRTNP